ncbi:TRAP transporter permease [Vreelandella titanicae]|uniref:C4-dicarboxylate TRAP transporter large permease protein DctM n=1 Tax=Vreelandella titanicae TaxID=664683 RepID=A0AAP9NRC9_9GAMM|nr:TRAP transporter permease [Halomonas titanicae]QKS26771.1 C4-dicarboxylate TRAP transporter large permease protein DctM [Halomonas titanicae]
MNSLPANNYENDTPSKERLAGLAKGLVIVLGSLGLLMTINQTFALWLFGFNPIGNAFLYYLIGLFLAVAFLRYPARQKDQENIPWYDWGLVAIVLAAAVYLGMNGLRIIELGWDYQAPLQATLIAAVLLGLVLEALRRCAGLVVFFVALFFGSYPLFADIMPGFMWGNDYSLGETVRAHVMGVESIIGIPMQVVANLVIGFIVFGATLTVTGGGEFFMKFATALMGQRRGGPAKVAVLSSGFMGSLSGSAISNILSTGPITIPTMKRVGYPSHYAASVEACASTGGTLMPPVMGAVAFIMASFLGVSYAEVMMAAFLPALLFYIVLIFQVDIYAARNGLKGLRASEIPDLWQTLKEGWPYLFSLAALIYMMLIMRIEAYAPYFASAVLILVSLFKSQGRLGFKGTLTLLQDLSVSVSNLVAILAGIGLVVGGLSYTGVAGAFSRELLLYADGSVPLMLIAGAVTSFVLGMGMTVSAVYIFLSILLAPALVAAGLNPLASHLFILYWGMMSYITPPVALAAITAANVAEANATKTSFYAMRMGAVLFVLPFLFVVNPSLILQGEWIAILQSSVTAVLAMWLLASGFEGYLYRIGRIAIVGRLVVLTVGGLFIYPEIYTDILGFSAIIVIYGVAALRGKSSLKLAELNKNKRVNKRRV